MDQSMLIATGIATLAAAISGYLAIDFLLKYLRKNSTMVFIIYRVLIGVTILMLLYKNILQP
jgi:undecaprenyl-diphosphatase